MTDRHTEPLLALRGVNLVYRALPALRDIDWSFEPGQHWACLGPNGAGKTSLANIISGQARQFTGELTRSDALRTRGVAYVCFEQARALCERDRKLDDSEFRADASDPGTTVRSLILGGRPADEEFHRWTRRLGIEHILGRGLRFISTGEMRKTLLAKLQAVGATLMEVAERGGPSIAAHARRGPYTNRQSRAEPPRHGVGI